MIGKYFKIKEFNNFHQIYFKIELFFQSKFFLTSDLKYFQNTNGDFAYKSVVDYLIKNI